jgi:hypothetical protein
MPHNPFAFVHGCDVYCPACVPGGRDSDGQTARPLYDWDGGDSDTVTGCANCHALLPFGLTSDGVLTLAEDLADRAVDVATGRQPINPFLRDAAAYYGRGHYSRDRNGPALSVAADVYERACVAAEGRDARTVRNWPGPVTVPFHGGQPAAPFTLHRILSTPDGLPVFGASITVTRWDWEEDSGFCGDWTLNTDRLTTATDPGFTPGPYSPFADYLLDSANVALEDAAADLAAGKPVPVYPGPTGPVYYSGGTLAPPPADPAP